MEHGEEVDQVGRGGDKVGEGALESSNEVCDVETPYYREGAKASAFCEAFQDVDIRGGGVVAVEDAYADGVMRLFIVSARKNKRHHPRGRAGGTHRSRRRCVKLSIFIFVPA